VPVARYLIDAAIVGGAAGVGIARGGIDVSPPGQDDRIVIVVELAGEEVGSSEPVVLGGGKGVVATIPELNVDATPGL